MNPSPDHQLRVMMTQYDLHPKVIIWDGNKHRLPGAGKKKGSDGWYRAYPNRRGAIFGDYSTGLEVNFGAKHDKPPSAAREEAVEGSGQRAQEGPHPSPCTGP